MIDKPNAARRALGRGLESLLPARSSPQPATPSVVAPTAEEKPLAGTPLELKLEDIERNPFQTRTTFDTEKMLELTQSIAAAGVVQPIVVRPLPAGRYQLITGERRLMGSIQAGKTTIPAIVRYVSDQQAMEMTIVENLQRADLNPMEQARAYHRLSHDFRMTQEQMAVRTGKDRASVTNYLRLLRLPDAVQRQVEAGELSFGHAKTLLSLGTPEQISVVAQRVLALSLSVRQTESHVAGLLNPEAKAAPNTKVKEPLDPNVYEALMHLERRLGLRVHIEDKRGKGRVIIEYANLDDFDRLLEMLDAHPK